EEEKKDDEDPGNEDSKILSTEEPRVDQEEKDNVNNTNRVNDVSLTVNTANNKVNAVGRKSSIKLPDDPSMPDLEDISIFEDSNEDVFGAEADLNNMESTFQVSHIPSTRIHKDYPLEQIIGDLQSAPQTRRMSKNLEGYGLVSTVKQRTNHKDLQNYLFACYFYQKWNPKRNKLDERGIVIKNKERLVARGHTQEKGIDDEAFAPVARIEAIWLFLAYASFKDFVVYQMDVKSAYLYGKIEEEVYVCQPPGFEDPDFSDKVYKVEKELSDCIKPQEHGLQVKQKEDRIFISQDKCKNEILNKFGFSYVKTASTHMETHKTLLKDEKGEDVDEHLYRSMIGSLMYLTSLRPDITDYAGASLDKKSTVGGCQFLRCRLILWQCKKQTVVANSTTEAEDSNEKKLIQMIKIHTDKNVADLLTKSFDATTKVKNINEEAQIHAKVDGKKVVISKASIMRDLWFGDEGEEIPNHTRIYVLPSHTKKVFGNIKTKKQKTRKPRRQDTDETQPSNPTTNVEDEAFNEENVPTQSNDPPLSRVNTLRSKEDSLKLKELMEICTKLSNRVLNLKTTKTAQAKEISSLNKRVKILKKKRRSRTNGLKRLYKIRLSARAEFSADEENIFGANDQDDTLMFDVDKDLQGEKVVVEETSRPKAKGIVMQEPSEATKTTIIPPIKSQDKGKDIMVEEPLKMKKIDQISFDEQEAKRLQAEIDEQDRLAAEEAQKALEANNAEEQEQLTDTEKARLFMEFLEKRRKFFAAKRNEEKRNRPPTKPQQRSIMSTYLKNMDGWKPIALKNKSFAEIKESLDKVMERINNFVDFITELVEENTNKAQAEIAQESSLKRAGDELEQDIAKK
nr:hypothetical protein [Tanacetum cinerariifolium]